MFAYGMMSAEPLSAASFECKSLQQSCCVVDLFVVQLEDDKQRLTERLRCLRSALGGSTSGAVGAVVVRADEAACVCDCSNPWADVAEQSCSERSVLARIDELNESSCSLKFGRKDFLRPHAAQRAILVRL